MLIFLCCFDGMYDFFFRLHGVLNFSDVPSVYLMFSAACRVLSLETLLNMSEVADLKYAGFYPMMPMPVPYPFNPVLGPRQHLPAFVSPKMQNKRKY